MVLYKDISKPVKDVISRDFPHGTPLDIEIKAVAAPTTFTATGTVTGSGNAASIQAAYAQDNIKATVKVTQNAVNLDTTIAAAKGTKFEGLSFFAKHDIVAAKGDDKAATTSTTELAAEFFATRCHSRLAVFPFKQTFNLSTLFGDVRTTGSCKIGASLEGKLNMSELKYSVGTVYANNSKGLTLGVNSAPAPFGLPSTFNLAAQVKKNGLDFGVTSDVQPLNLGATTTSFAVSKSVNASTSYKFKLEKGKAAAALTQKLADNLTASLGLEADGKDQVKFGTKLFFTQ